MLDLSAEQQTAVITGEPVLCLLNQTECIVVRKDIFERMKHVAYDVSEWTHEEMIAMAEFAASEADNAGPIE